MTAARAAAAPALGLALGAAACVRIETGPEGVASARLEPAPPSLVAGDVLRDTAGAPTALVAVAFDDAGNPVTTLRPRYTFVPVVDTAAGAAPDTALVVDSVTGTVRATTPVRRPNGRVAAVIGERLQLLQTLEIVFRPDSIGAAAPAAGALRLRYDCTDPGGFALLVPTGGSDLFQFNALALPAVTAYGTDTLGAAGRPLRRRLVRWEVDSSPFAGNRIPRVPSGPGRADSVPAIAITAGASDALLRVDTTGADGRSTVRLRIRPAALGSDAVPARSFVVRVRARGQPGPRPLARESVVFRVQLERTGTPVGGATATCP